MKIRYLILMAGTALISGNAFAEIASGTWDNGSEGSGTWTISDDGTLTVSGTGKINNYTTKGVNYASSAPWGSYIYTRSGSNSPKVKNVIIDEGITDIGRYAFSSPLPAPYYGCSNCFGTIENISLPSTLKTIGQESFLYASNLSSVTIPQGVTSIGGSAFKGAKNLNSITIPEGVTKIGGSTFSGAENLNSITIPEGVTEIGIEAFSGCTNLKVINLPSTLEYVSEKVFQGTSVEAVIIPEGATNWHFNAFSKSNVKVIYCSEADKATCEQNIARCGREWLCDLGALESLKTYTKTPDGTYITSDGKKFSSLENMSAGYEMQGVELLTDDSNNEVNFYFM